MPTVLPDAQSKARAARESEFRLTGAHVLAMLVAFFAIVLCVNLVMIRFALKTHSGEVTAHPYEKGLAYNSTIREAREQEARGWKVEGKMMHTANGMARIEVSARDSAGAALTGLKVHAILAAPADVRRDRPLELTETAPGLYSGETAAQTGQWELELNAVRDGKRLFQSHNRITLH
ncbi:MAG: FixH family protein [Rhodoblastus sp.]